MFWWVGLSRFLHPSLCLWYFPNCFQLFMLLSQSSLVLASVVTGLHCFILYVAYWALSLLIGLFIPSFLIVHRLVVCLYLALISHCLSLTHSLWHSPPSLLSLPALWLVGALGCGREGLMKASLLFFSFTLLPYGGSLSICFVFHVWHFCFVER